ncbi:MAG: ribonuclease HII [Nitrososphaerota archaeon]|nr:ribonuclease HII [Nitrososphaerota archaeon]
MGESNGPPCSPTGCLLGPLVVAGISIERSKVRKLKEIGVKDSKLLSAARRDELYPQIRELAEHVHWVGIPPREIDEVVTTGRRLRKLNYLEAIYFARVIAHLGAEKVTVDASDAVADRFGRDISANLAAKVKIASLHKADMNFPIVSAASIVAKVERDRQVELLKQVHGDFGSGYPSDPVTTDFFTRWLARGAPLPLYVRKSWKTWDRYARLAGLPGRTGSPTRF